MRSKALRLAVPATLALVGAGVLSGCIFIPTFGVTTHGKNIAGEVGDARSRKPVRVDRATIEDVYRILGPPEYATPDNSQVAYTWRVLNGVWVGLLCAGPQEGSRALVLTFDREGVLRSFAVVERNDGFLTKASDPPLPADMRPAPTGPVLVPSPRPVTIPGVPAGPQPPDPIPTRPAGTAPAAAPLPPDAVPYRTSAK